MSMPYRTLLNKKTEKASKHLEENLKTHIFATDCKECNQTSDYTGHHPQLYGHMKKSHTLTISIVLCLLFCFLTPTLMSYAQNKEQQLKYKQERFQAGIRLTNMMRNGGFKLALLFLDTLKAKYPRDPQFPFAEGYIYDMQGNSIKARPAFEKSLSLYDSIIAADSNSGQVVNRLIIL